MIWGTLLTATLGYQSVYLRVKAPPETKVEYRTTLNMDAGSEGELEAFIFSGCRILSNVRTQYRCRIFISDAKANGTGSFRAQTGAIRQLKGTTADYNRTAMNTTISAWNAGKKFHFNYLDGYTSIIFPEAPVAVGSTWTQDQMLGGMLIRMNYELVGFGSEKYNRTAFVQSVIEPGQDMQTMEPNQYVIDLDTGLIRRAAGKFVFTLDDQNVTASFKITRASLIIPPAKLLNKQPTKKAPVKKITVKKKPG